MSKDPRRKYATLVAKPPPVVDSSNESLASHGIDGASVTMSRPDLIKRFKDKLESHPLAPTHKSSQHDPTRITQHHGGSHIKASSNRNYDGYRQVVRPYGSDPRLDAKHESHNTRLNQSPPPSHHTKGWTPKEVVGADLDSLTAEFMDSMDLSDLNEEAYNQIEIMVHQRFQKLVNHQKKVQEQTLSRQERQVQLNANSGNSDNDHGSEPNNAESNPAIGMDERNEAEEAYEASSENDDDDDFYFSYRPVKRRLPKFVKPNIHTEPRPLCQLPEPPPVPKWPQFVKTVLNPPQLLHYPPHSPEILELCYQPVSIVPGPIKDDANLVFEASSGKWGDTLGAATNALYLTDPTLVFESRFECGNLHKAYRVGRSHYNLLVNQDFNTKGHTQWYFFKISGLQADREYRFDISNMMKKNSLYNNGMRPLMYSEALASNGIGWHRVGYRISYNQNKPAQTSNEDGDVADRPLHTLTFHTKFPVENDTVYFAHCYPYSYTHLQYDLKDLKNNPEINQCFRHTLIGKTLCGNNLDMLTITTPVSSPEELHHRKAIVLSARVHPGETNSSWMMRGLLRYLTSNFPRAKYLRDHFVIKVIPMLNPDGVILGNYRCNLRGYDLNRQWLKAANPSAKDVIPEICAIRDVIQRTHQLREVVFYCDLHGHNRKQGIFIYGCHNERESPPRSASSASKRKPKKVSLANIKKSKSGQDGDPQPQEAYHEMDNHMQYKERVFPLLLSRIAGESLFQFKRCQFQMQKSKEGTGRICVRKTFGILNSFTMEASFCGSDISKIHFSTVELEKMGEAFGETLYEYFADNGKKQEHVLSELRNSFHAGSTNFVPDDSASSETTSDDEKLRIKVKPKKVLTKRKPVPAVAKAQVQQDQPIQVVGAKKSNGSNSSLTKPQEKKPPAIVKEPAKVTKVRISSASRQRPSSATPRTTFPFDQAAEAQRTLRVVDVNEDARSVRASIANQTFNNIVLEWMNSQPIPELRRREETTQRAPPQAVDTDDRRIGLSEYGTELVVKANPKNYYQDSTLKPRAIKAVAPKHGGGKRAGTKTISTSAKLTSLFTEQLEPKHMHRLLTLASRGQLFGTQALQEPSRVDNPGKLLERQWSGQSSIHEEAQLKQILLAAAAGGGGGGGGGDYELVDEEGGVRQEFVTNYYGNYNVRRAHRARI